MKSQASVNEIVKFTLRLLHLRREETSARSQIRKIRAPSGKWGLVGKRSRAFPYKYLQLPPLMPVCVPNKNLTGKLVTRQTPALFLLSFPAFFFLYYFEQCTDFSWSRSRDLVVHSWAQIDVAAWSREGTALIDYSGRLTSSNTTCAQNCCDDSRL